LSNAGKFTKPGGTITFRARLGEPVTAPAQEAGALTEGRAGIALIVEDTGRGIPPEAMPRIFEKFYQVERGDTRTAGGAGLGLYIVKQLVEAMNGRVRVESAPEQGSQFTVEFPVHSPARA
jgi:signal transduction histidine kinase